MAKVAQIHKRKADHIRINLEQDVHSGLINGLEHFSFIHEALPELDLNSIDSTITLFNKKVNSPILISSMTGGTKDAMIINRHLAEAAQQIGVAMGVGSQRVALEDSGLSKSFSITRLVAPDILLFANLGAVQLNYGYGFAECQRAVDMLQADGLCLHLNPLQEAVQKGGETNFSGLAKKIEAICRRIAVPVIIKEVGWGISERSAKILVECGVSAIDVAGAGGTSWSQVEMHRAPDDFTRQLAAAFIRWGIPTADSIINVKKVQPQLVLFASGGLKDGVDIAKCIALGASLGGIAGQFLKAAAVSTEKVVELLTLLKRQLELTMFVSGVKDIRSLQTLKLEKSR
jgi:isopentenyl-diphosphate delta-isomerase